MGDVMHHRQDRPTFGPVEVDDRLRPEPLGSAGQAVIDGVPGIVLSGRDTEDLQDAKALLNRSAYHQAATTIASASSLA